MGTIFNELIYQPFFNLLIIIYNWLPFHDFGIAIIVFTILLKLVLSPLAKKQIESQRKMQELQPKIKEIQKKYKDNKEKQSKEIMAFYKENKTNPMSGCLPLILQLIFLIAIYRVLFNISNAGLNLSGLTVLYPFVHNPGQINEMFLGVINLTHIVSFSNLTIIDLPQIILVILTAILQYIQAKMMLPKSADPIKDEKEEDISQALNKQMVYFGPLITLYIGFKFPAGLSLYWLVMTVYSIMQQRAVIKKDQGE